MIRSEMMQRMSAREFVTWIALAEIDAEKRKDPNSREQSEDEIWAMLTEEDG